MKAKNVNVSEEMLERSIEKALRSVKEASSPNWMRILSLVTAGLAVFTALGSLKAGSFSSQALMNKNEAVLNQARASDQWAFYQSKSIKATIKEGELDRAGKSPRAKKLSSDIERYEKEKDEISAKAKSYELKADEAGKRVLLLMVPGKNFSLSVTLFQVAIALSGLAALTRRRYIWFVGLVVALFGMSFFIKGYWLASQIVM
jgi:hypothetical protein